MFAVIFVVQPKKDRFDEYLELAKALKPQLQKIDGFVDNERFRSRQAEGRLLSLSTWRNEKAVIRWRTHEAHHEVQKKGREEVFEDYHLRVGEITSDTNIPKGQKLEQHNLDETEIGRGKVMTISEFSPANDDEAAGAALSAALGIPRDGNDGVIEQEVFEDITNSRKLLLLVSWRNVSAADQWKAGLVTRDQVRHRHVRVIRDYGMTDRREAPQYYPPLSKGQRSATPAK
jgi:heme-degrading monooxygenase HmoA